MGELHAYRGNAAVERVRRNREADLMARPGPRLGDAVLAAFHQQLVGHTKKHADEPAERSGD